MGQLLFAEHLKMNRTMVKKLLILAPLVTLGISFLAGSFFYSCALNWWYTMFFPVVLAIICVQIQEKEKKKLDYRNVYMSPVSFNKVWISKALLATVYGLFTSVFLSVIVIAVTKIMGVTMETGILAAFIAGFLIFLLCAYQIPVYLFLAKRFNFIAVFMTSIVFAALGVIYAEKSYWFMVPPAWCNRSMYSVLHIMTNGLFLDNEQKYLLISNNNIIAIVCCSIGLFILGTVLTGLIVKREAEKQ